VTTENDDDASAGVQPMMEDLTRQECWQLLAGRSIGRLAVIAEHDLPFVVPVNYAIDGDSVVFRSDFGTKFVALQRHPVAFQVDSIDEHHRAGWTVLIQGIAHEMTPQEAEHLTLEPWTGPKQRWLRVVPRHMSGRRLRGRDEE
jgi:nitroimidazol reductase NimA-like FMN-containing flavoprotein (pyridoxamine 5'-phosphate oxidase superfamily)